MTTRSLDDRAARDDRATDDVRAARFVLGIDGGGTRTRAAIVDLSGRLLGLGEGGPSNLNVSGRDGVRDAVRDAVEAARVDAVRDAGRSAGTDAGTVASDDVGSDRDQQPFAAAFLGLAGVVTPRDHAEIRSIASELGLAPDNAVGVDHDLRIALAGGLGGSAGIVLIAGTGSSCYGRTDDGATWRAGGWGPLIDDPGSGYWLGVRAMATVCRSVDGRGPATALERALPDSLGLDSAGDLLRMTGTGGLTRERIAALAPLVLDAADAGDASATRIVAEAIDELARMVEAVERRLFAGNATMLTMTGGLTERRSFRDALERAITARSPSVRPVASRLPPVLGAAALALASIGALDDDIVARLEESARRRFTTTGA